MVTPTDLTAQEIAELKAFTQQEDLQLAVRVAMREYLRFVNRQRLRGLAGRVTMAENWQDVEAEELKTGHHE